MAESGVLLHLPFATQAIPEWLVPQSELICRRLFRCVPLTSCLFLLRFSLPAAFPLPARLLSDILAHRFTGIRPAGGEFDSSSKHELRQVTAISVAAGGRE